MDAWTDVQVEKMKNGGNQRCKDFLEKHGIDTASCSIRDKYDTQAGQLYQQVINARVAGEPEPTQLPPAITRSPNAASPSAIKKPMAGFGSPPPPSPEPGIHKKVIQKHIAAAGVFLQVLKSDATDILEKNRKRIQNQRQQRTERRSSIMKSLNAFGIRVEK